MNLRIETLEDDLQKLLGDPKLVVALCALLKATSPKIYKDQLAGAKQVLSEHIKQHGALCPKLLGRLIDTPRLTATGLRERLNAYQQHLERLKGQSAVPSAPAAHAKLARYGALNGQSSGQVDSHVSH